MNPKNIFFTPGRIILTSFLFAIGFGTFLLYLPQSRMVEISFINLLFTSASAICVTGLKVIPISSFTPFGQCVILGLIQIGGLGLMTLSFFMVSLFLNFGMTTKLLAGQILEFETWNKIKKFLVLIIGVTFISELIGTLILHTQFSGDNAWFLSFFHSVSAFCNAGISLFDNNLMSFNSNIVIISTISMLMFAGSIGFIVWYDFARLIKYRFKNIMGDRKVVKLSLHTKLALGSSLVLIFVGAVFFLALENNNLLKDLSPIYKFFNSIFTSIASRGIGYNTLNIEKATISTLLFFLPFMFIGASPGSTGSGIKTTTFVLFLYTVLAILRNRQSVEIRGRTIPPDQIYKVVAIIAIGIFWIFTTAFVLLLTNPQFTFMQILFESVSTFGCCGLSTGITSGLSVSGRIMLIITMLIGRIGSLTLVLALRKTEKKHLYKYPEERVMIG